MHTFTVQFPKRLSMISGTLCPPAPTGPRSRHCNVFRILRMTCPCATYCAVACLVCVQGFSPLRSAPTQGLNPNRASIRKDCLNMTLQNLRPPSRENCTPSEGTGSKPFLETGDLHPERLTVPTVPKTGRIGLRQLKNMCDVNY